MSKVLVIGGGMITHDQILPSLLHLERTGRVDGIEVCSRRQSTIDALAQADFLREAFPCQSFSSFAGDYRERIAALPPRSIVVVATPDPLHYEMVMAALEAGQHVICVKPLVLKLAEAREIEHYARERGLFVGVEYHKRFDDRSLMARKRYREGLFGEFRLGTACLLEKWYYRESNFQNWFTRENSDAFTYIGCHYVDLVAFITGLMPVAVSVFGIPDRFPNGKEGYLWTDARVIWSNGACLNVQNALGFPNAAPGTNTQSLTLYCSGGGNGALISHSDQYRGLKYSYTNGQYAEPSPDYFQYVEWSGPGLKPVGYGYRSIEALVEACASGAVDHDLIATPANSCYNEAVIEAARESLARNGETIQVCS
ncbi:MAG TPA: Gfo/Idh/MocA family oxidoreductase [Bryobacteraceae bacterium]|nr:Gfo/Idh/MocA family oxidoreductase [Bryobacteraceae bacterium]